jgi:hypothetical protein
MQRRALLGALGAALGLAGCSGRSTEGQQTRRQTVPEESNSSPHQTSNTDTPSESPTQMRTSKTPTTNTSTPTETVTRTRTPHSDPVNLRIGYEAHFRDHFGGEAAPSGKQWLIIRYKAYNSGSSGASLAPADFHWIGDNETVDTPTGPVPYTFLGRRSYTTSDAIYPDQSVIRSMTFAVPRSATSQRLDLDYAPPATIEMYPTNLPDQRNCQLEGFDCKGL